MHSGKLTGLFSPESITRYKDTGAEVSTNAATLHPCSQLSDPLGSRLYGVCFVNYGFCLRKEN